MNASQILKKAAGHMEDRASTYDKPDGERSMAQTVAIFNLFHGTSLTEAQGWHLLQILKDVRLFSRPGYHADSAEDCTAYSALKAEAKSAEAYAHMAQVASQAAELIVDCRAAAEDFLSLPEESVECPDCGACWGGPHACGKPGYQGAESPAEAEWTEADEHRMDVVGQNGNDGAAYNSKGPCLSCGGPHNLVRCGRNREEGKA